jgi:hypothetical protein
MNMKEKPSSGTKQFLLTLLATTFSIILTFGTSAIIDRRHKEAAKKEMVMMIIYDFDKTIEQVQYADSVFRQAFKAQQDAILHPEHFNSYYSTFMTSVQLTYTEFSETTEMVFSSNIETFNTLGNVNFIHEVSAFYNLRRFYQENVMDEFKNEVYGSGIAQSLENLIKVSFPDHYINNLDCLINLKKIRNRCVQMMKVSEEELKEFSRLRSVVEDEVSEEDERIHEQAVQEFIEAEKALIEAREKFAQDK